MDQNKILGQFIDYKNDEHIRFIELLQDSISFSAREKAFMIIDFHRYNQIQKQKLVKALESDRRLIKDLEHEYPEEYGQRAMRSKKAWIFMLERLAEYMQEQKTRQAKNLDYEELMKLRQKLDQD